MATQKARILSLLQTGPVCAWDLYSYRMPRFAARIHELRQDGYLITTEHCTAPYHHPTVKGHVAYVLHQRGQQTLEVG